MSDETEDSKALLCRITEEMWTEGRLDLIEELVAENFKDHVECRAWKARVASAIWHRL